MPISPPPYLGSACGLNSATSFPTSQVAGLYGGRSSSGASPKSSSAVVLPTIGT